MYMDVECPYCKHKQDINHDDGYGYEEGQMYEQECSKCEKIFVYTTTIHFNYSVYVAPCKNGGEHKFNPCQGCPTGYMSNRHRCEYCDEVHIINESLIYNLDEDTWIEKEDK